jgi:SAM-dependent methyltransferase
MSSQSAMGSTQIQEDGHYASSTHALRTIKSNLRNTWLHPRHLAQREIAKFVRAEGPGLKGRMLDVGCGKKQYLQHVPNVRAYVAVDVPSAMYGAHHADVLASVLALPFESATFDSVLCTEVLEHTPDPSLGLQEMARVAKSGAKMLLTVPLSEQLHEEPNDHCRFTRHWLSYLLDKNGWRIEKIQERGGAWLELAYRFSSLLYSSTGAKIDSAGNLRPRLFLGPPVVLVCAAVQFAGHLLNKVWPCPLSTIGYTVVAERK